MTMQEYMDKNFAVIDATSQGMSLQDAIEELKRHHINVDFTPDEFLSGWIEEPAATAIATILNAVVKGELRYDNDR